MTIKAPKPKFKEGQIINCQNLWGRVIKNKGYIIPLGCYEYIVKVRISEDLLLELMKDESKRT